MIALLRLVLANLQQRWREYRQRDELLADQMIRLWKR